jgi:hypothetical protein
MELLTRVLPYDLGARTAIEFPPKGIKFMLELPAEHLNVDPRG